MVCSLVRGRSPFSTSPSCLGIQRSEFRLRRQGIGAAVTLAPLLEARDMGYEVGILHASPMGLGMYGRVGFQECCRMSHYVWRAE